jgi:hypothetical protein
MDDEIPDQQLPRESMLHFIGSNWTRDESLADISSTASAEKKKKVLPLPVRGSSSSLTPRPIPRSTSYRRLNSNIAMREILSEVSWRTDSSLYYLENGRLGPAKPRRRNSDPGNPYQFPNPIDEH